MARTQSRVLTNQDDIRKWAEERNAAPACVRGTGSDNDIGVLRLDFPGYSGEQSLEHIDWDDWLDKFEERGLALLVQDRTAAGERSNFNKIVARETAASAGRGSRSASRGARGAGRKSSARKSRSSATSSRKTTRKSASAKKSRRRSSSSASRRKTVSRKVSASTRAKSTSRRKTGSPRSSSQTKARKSAAARSASTARSRRNSGTRSQAASRRGSPARTNSRGRSSSKSHVLVDHDEIRRWAEERRAEPACVRGTGSGDDPGMIRLDFPGFSGARSLEHIDWDEWFRAFDKNKLALLVQDTTARGQRSNFNKLVARENVMRGESRAGRTSRQRASSNNPAPKKAVRGSTRAHRTESARGRSTSDRKAA